VWTVFASTICLGSLGLSVELRGAQQVSKSFGYRVGKFQCRPRRSTSLLKSQILKSIMEFLLPDQCLACKKAWNPDILRLCAMFLCVGDFKYESANDWRLQQCCQQFFPVGWWLKVRQKTHTCSFPALLSLLYLLLIMCPVCYSIPFSVDDLTKSTEQMSISDIEPPPLIKDNTGFSFLLEN